MGIETSLLILFCAEIISIIFVIWIVFRLTKKIFGKESIYRSIAFFLVCLPVLSFLIFGVVALICLIPGIAPDTMWLFFGILLSPFVAVFSVLIGLVQLFCLYKDNDQTHRNSQEKQLYSNKQDSLQQKTAKTCPLISKSDNKYVYTIKFLWSNFVRNITIYYITMFLYGYLHIFLFTHVFNFFIKENNVIINSIVFNIVPSGSVIAFFIIAYFQRSDRLKHFIFISIVAFLISAFQLLFYLKGSFFELRNILSIFVEIPYYVFRVLIGGGVGSLIFKSKLTEEKYRTP